MKKEKKLNNKGFTLIEVLAVIVILVIIVSIAIPNISASLDRQSKTIIENKGELVASAAQFYVSDNRGTKIKQALKLDNANTSDDLELCKIDACVLKGQDIDVTKNCKNTFDQNNEKYITSDDLKDNDGNSFDGYVVYNVSEESYTFCFDGATASKYGITNDSSVCSTTTKCY